MEEKLEIKDRTRRFKVNLIGFPERIEISAIINSNTY